MSRKKKLDKALVKECVLVIFSFILGSIVMLLLIKFTPIKENFGKKEIQIYEKNSLAQSVEKVFDAVVLVQSYNHGTIENTGTGFIYKEDDKYGYILTNEHVISNDDETKVVLSTDEEVPTKVLGKDQYLDLAVLRIDKKYVTLVVTTSSSEKINLGDTVFTVGSPLGYDYRGSVTSGVLSGKDRMVSTSLSDSDEDDWIMQVIQIDASINPGNSGGPLLNAKGEVIGVCSLKLVDDDIEGMGFAIPIEYALNHVDYLEKGKKIKWPVLGIGMINVTDTAKLARNNLPTNYKIEKGVVVKNIKKKSSADIASLKEGDIIIKIDDNEVKDIAHLKYELYKHNVGDEIKITYVRNNKEKNVKITLNNSN